MQTKRHVALEHPNFLESLGWEFPQMRGRPFEKDRIDRIHFREPILPFDQTIDRGAGCLGQVKKDDGLFGFAAPWHRSGPRLSSRFFG